MEILIILSCTLSGFGLSIPVINTKRKLGL